MDENLLPFERVAFDEFEKVFFHIRDLLFESNQNIKISPSPSPSPHRGEERARGLGRK